MATGTKKKSPKKAEKRSPKTTETSGPIHRIEVDDVILSVFPDYRAVLQRRFRNQEGMTGFAHSLRPKDWTAARKALHTCQVWYEQYAEDQEE